jgi:RNA polymerase sigma-70 factor (ECF subfamily)
LTDELSENLPGDTDDPLQVLALAEDHDQLRRALSSLSPDYQNVLVLRFINDVPHAEVAEIMGKSEANARVLQHRALKALANALETIQQGGLL